MSGTRLQNTICYSLLALVFLLSLVLRIAVPWDQVFSGGWIKFTDNDAYFYVRLLDNLSRHFPSLSSFDPYYIYPDGIGLGGRPLFFVYLMGFIAWLIGGGAPSQHTVDLVAVLFPAVTGALLVLPVFLLGRTIFNRWAGLAAAGFIALMPGEFLARTLLGNTDSHVLEIFLSSFFMLFLLLSVHHGKGLAFYPWRREYRQRLTMPICFGTLAGFCLGLYLLSWQGAPLFIFISFTWLVLQCVSDHLRGRAADATALACFSAYLIALVIVLVWLPNALSITALSAGLAAAAALPLLSYYLRSRRAKASAYPVAVICMGLAAALSAYMISPRLYAEAVGAITGFFTWQYTAPIAEMQPLLVQQGSFSFNLAWGNFTAASVMAALALAVVVFRAIKRGGPEIVMLAVWSIITLLAALAMRRFAYYLAINVALLAGYAGWLVLRWGGLKNDQMAAMPAPPPGKSARKKATNIKVKNSTGKPIRLALGVAVVAVLVIYPNTGPLPGGDKPFFDVATRALYAPSNAWCESMDWMRNNTPEPFGDAAYYYQFYKQAPSINNNAGPAAAYSVLCWWDYGYWVSRIGHRVPFSNSGSSNQIDDWRYFMAQSARAADNICATWNIRYVIVNDHLAERDSGFNALAAYTRQPSATYSEIYYRLKQDKLAPTLLYYPEYYRTMAVRLYCFDGKEYVPQETAAVSWESKTGADGLAYKEITGLKTFRSCAEAEAFVAAQKTGNWRIVGKDPLASPVPLEALEGYRPAFASSQKVRVGNNEIAEVKIFEYNP